jgi:hypothetical protein
VPSGRGGISFPIQRISFAVTKLKMSFVTIVVVSREMCLPARVRLMLGGKEAAEKRGKSQVKQRVREQRRKEGKKKR